MTLSQTPPFLPQKPLVDWIVGDKTALRPKFAGFALSTIAKIARFSGVGLASSILYALAVMSATSGLGIHPDASAIIGYAVTIPFNFCAHRWFTFDSTRGIGGDALRYIATQAVAIIVSGVAMAICVDIFHAPYAGGIAATIILVPVLTYLMLDRWALGPREGAPR